MSLNIGDLLVQLLPGFLSLWVFSRITAENLDNRSDWILVMLGLCFGMFNLSVVSLLCLALKAGGIIQSFSQRDSGLGTPAL
nr:hypothetical protein [uncultured Dethiosulfovibrio sp.]